MSYAILPALIPDIEKVYDAYFSAFKGDLMGDIMVKRSVPRRRLTFKEWRAADYPSFSEVRKAKAAAAAAALVAPVVVAAAAADKTEVKVTEVAVEVKEVVA
ncbi:predicted protein [Verticillium alfalfae VaMs.102]|uniref:Predicted protein n=1 Tax=Verticillium alfalfae (strain VaMs.102 / ATCC MYA-4576 / FGSC 10136) TaxID=526221 RepID=C9SWJ0_VERA1|nr:predicted protein [Verticillium alfalfae VaMs.102]EEY23155.1 predicted protein [Verticillium alfalfae VaMs.102]